MTGDKKIKDIENILWGITFGLGFGGLTVALARLPPMLGLFITMGGIPLSILILIIKKSLR